MAVGVVDRLEVVEVDVDHRSVADAALERVLDAVHEQQAVGQPGERVVEGLVLELDLQLAQLVDLGGQAVLADRGARLVGEGVEEPDLGGTEVAAVARAVGDHHRPDRAADAGQRCEHRALDAEELQVAGERAPHLLRGHEPRRGVPAHELGQLAHHVLVERLHDLEPARATDGDPRARALALGGEQADLRHLAAEVLERLREQARDARRRVGRGRQRAARLVQELEVGGLAALGEMGPIGEEDGEHGRDQQDDRARVGLHHRRRREPEARVDRRDADRHPDDRGELACLDAVPREPHRRVHEQHRDDDGQQHGERWRRSRRPVRARRRPRPPRGRPCGRSRP